MQENKTYKNKVKELISLKDEFKTNQSDDLFYKINLLDFEIKELDKSVGVFTSNKNRY